jgi:hypothetical protein
MEALFVILVAAAVIWGIIKKYAGENPRNEDGSTPGRRRSDWQSTSSRSSQPWSLLDELRRRHEQENRDASDPLKKQPDTARHIPLTAAEEKPREKPRPVPVTRETEEPVTAREAAAPTAKPTRRPVPVARIRDPWEPPEEQKEPPRPEPKRPQQTSPKPDVPRPLPLATAPAPAKGPATRPDVPKPPVAPPSRYVPDHPKATRPSTSKAALADYQKQIGGAVWDERVNRLIKANIPGGEEFLATVIGSDASVLVVTDRRITIIQPGDVRTFDSTDYRVLTWAFSDIQRIDLVKDWLRCTLTIVTADDPAPPENTFTYQRMYYEKVETLVEQVRERIGS